MSENVHSLPHRDLKGHWLQLFMPTALWWTLTLARMLLTRQTGPTTYSEAVQTESCLTITETSDKYRELHFSLCRLPPNLANSTAGTTLGSTPWLLQRAYGSAGHVRIPCVARSKRPWSSQWPCRDSKYVWMMHKGIQRVTSTSTCTTQWASSLRARPMSMASFTGMINLMAPRYGKLLT